MQRKAEKTVNNIKQQQQQNVPNNANKNGAKQNKITKKSGNELLKRCYKVLRRHKISPDKIH